MHSHHLFTRIQNREYGQHKNPSLYLKSCLADLLFNANLAGKSFYEWLAISQPVNDQIILETFPQVLMNTVFKKIIYFCDEMVNFTCPPCTLMNAEFCFQQLIAASNYNYCDYLAFRKLAYSLMEHFVCKQQYQLLIELVMAGNTLAMDFCFAYMRKSNDFFDNFVTNLQEPQKQNGFIL